MINASQKSIKSYFKRFALNWSIATSLIMAIFMIGAFWIVAMKESEERIQLLAKSITSVNRNEILSGDIRGLELKLRKGLNLKDNENLIFLDENQVPWVEGKVIQFRSEMLNPFEVKSNYLDRSLEFLEPIDFGEGSRWGYLYLKIEPKSQGILFFVTLGLLFLSASIQIIGFYKGLMQAVHVMGDHLSDWASNIRRNPKADLNSLEVPFVELAPIHNALSGLKDEISKLELAAKVEGQLLAIRGMGHDLLNPVARMKRIIGLVEEKAKKGISIDEKAIRNLKANLNRLSSYGEFLKVLHESKSNGKKVRYEVLNLSIEFNSIIDELRTDPEILDKSVEILSFCEPEIFAHMSRSIFFRVIENLVRNAAQASKMGQSISLELTRTNDAATLIVIDSGVGISIENMDKIFSPDFTTKPTGGTGLGLYIVNQFCNEVGGTVSVESSAGNGAKFIVQFPIKERIHELQNTISG